MEKSTLGSEMIPVRRIWVRETLMVYASHRPDKYPD
jgi:hypothetical protein